MAPTDHGVDATLQAFRRLLGRTATDDAARVEALSALAKRTVFVTANPDGRLRALANRNGRTALPVFTGRDSLGLAAVRFGWFRPDGGLDAREIGAREALRAALERGVEYLVIDIGTEHQAEITRLEINAALAARRPTGSVPKPAAERPSEIIRDAVRNSVRPQDIDGFELAAPEPVGAPTPEPAPTVGSPIDIDLPFTRSARERAPTERAVLSPAQASRPTPRAAPRVDPPAPLPKPQLPLAEAPAAARIDPPAPLPKPQPPAAPAGQNARHEPVDFGTADVPDLPSIDLAVDTPYGAASRALASEPEAQPGALQAAALVRDIARKSGDADVEEAAAEVAAMLQRTALEGGVQKKKKGGGVVASEIARMLGGEASHEEENAEAPEAEDAPLLDDDALAAIAEALRKYPEVEWACDLSPARGEPVIGVRVDPSFMARAEQITAEAIAAVAPNDLTVTMLTDPAKMRSARSAGSVFFPWKGKR